MSNTAFTIDQALMDAFACYTQIVNAADVDDAITFQAPVSLHDALQPASSAELYVFDHMPSSPDSQNFEFSEGMMGGDHLTNFFDMGALPAEMKLDF